MIGSATKKTRILPRRRIEAKIRQLQALISWLGDNEILAAEHEQRGEARIRLFQKLWDSLPEADKARTSSLLGQALMALTMELGEMEKKPRLETARNNGVAFSLIAAACVLTGDEGLRRAAVVATRKVFEDLSRFQKAVLVRAGRIHPDPELLARRLARS